VDLGEPIRIHADRPFVPPEKLFADRLQSYLVNCLHFRGLCVKPIWNPRGHVQPRCTRPGKFILCVNRISLPNNYSTSGCRTILPCPGCAFDYAFLFQEIQGVADRGPADVKLASQIGLGRKLAARCKGSFCDQPFNALSCLFVELCSDHSTKRCNKFASKSEVRFYAEMRRSELEREVPPINMSAAGSSLNSSRSTWLALAYSV